MSDGETIEFIIDNWDPGVIADRMCNRSVENGEPEGDPHDRKFDEAWEWGYFHGCEIVLTKLIPLMELVEIYRKTTRPRAKHEARELIFDEVAKIKEALGIR